MKFNLSFLLTIELWFIVLNTKTYQIINGSFLPRQVINSVVQTDKRSIIGIEITINITIILFILYQNGPKN